MKSFIKCKPFCAKHKCIIPYCHRLAKMDKRDSTCYHYCRTHLDALRREKKEHLQQEADFRLFQNDIYLHPYLSQYHIHGTHQLQKNAREIKELNYLYDLEEFFPLDMQWRLCEIEYLEDILQ